MLNESPEAIYQLDAALSLGGPHDGILIPIYSCYPSNDYFVATTDEVMEIASFRELDILHDYLCRVDVDACAKTQFVVGDISPVIIRVAGSDVIIHAEDVSNLIAAITICAVRDTAIAKEAIHQLHDLDVSLQKEPYSADLKWDNLSDGEVSPKAARLWLDVAVAGLNERYGEESATEETKSYIRIQLLSWATKIAVSATSPIFRHFVEVAKRVERRGVYVQDIMGVAIVNWVCQDVARVDKLVDLIRDYRGSYGRGPLTSVLELADHRVPTLSSWADETIARYHDLMRKIMDKAEPYELLARTFVADDGSHWPDDLRDALLKRTAAQESTLSALLDERQKLLGQISIGNPRRDLPSFRTHLFVKLRALAGPIRSSAARVDALHKALSDAAAYREYHERFKGIDYYALGLSQEFFVSLERPED